MTTNRQQSNQKITTIMVAITSDDTHCK